MGVRNRRFGLFKTRAARATAAADDARIQNNSYPEDVQLEGQSEERELTAEESRAATDADSAAPETAAKPKWPWQKQVTTTNDSAIGRGKSGAGDQALFQNGSDDQGLIADLRREIAALRKRLQRRNFFGLFGFLLLLFLFAIFLIFLFFGIKRLGGEDYDYWKSGVCRYILNDDCGVAPIVVTANPLGPPVLTEQSVLTRWNSETPSAFVLQNKFDSLNVNYSRTSNSHLNTGNNLIGLYEKREERRIEAGVHFLLAGSTGDFDARELFDDLSLSDADKRRAQTDFVELHKLNGRDGYFRLGQLYLGDWAIQIGAQDFPYPEPLYAKHAADGYRNTFIVSAPNYSEAYINMQIAVLCDVTEAIQWQGYISRLGGLGRAEQETYRREAAQRLKERGQIAEGGIADHCEGRTLRRRIEMLTDDAVIWRFINDRRAWPTMEELTRKLLLPEIEFQTWIGVLIYDACTIYGFDDEYRCSRSYQPGSQYYRNSPAGDSTSRGVPGNYGGVSTPARDGLPDDCVGLAVGEECSSRRRDLECRSRSEAMFKLGEAYLAVGNTTEAQRQLQLAITEGRECQSEYARLAAKRLQAFNLTCEYSEPSLARISRDSQNNPTGGGVISLSERQQALRALRHYDGKIDGKYGPMTRRAFRSFQGSLGFEETGDLTPIETVYLICSAAEISDDPMSMNTLGKMYLTGLGTVQNTDAGLHWLKRAAGEDRSGRYVYRNANALFNLALAYGTGTVASSYKLCGLVENIEQADQFLVEAANLGHPIAIRIINGYGDLPPDERWENLKAELQLDAFHRERMVAVGEGCRSNP